MDLMNIKNKREADMVLSAQVPVSTEHCAHLFIQHLHVNFCYCVWLQYRIMGIIRERKCSRKLHPSDLHWNAYRSQAGFSAITALQLDLHLWAGINKTKKWKSSKKIFANILRFAKFANIFFRELFPLYGIWYTSKFYFLVNKIFFNGTL